MFGVCRTCRPRVRSTARTGRCASVPVGGCPRPRSTGLSTGSARDTAPAFVAHWGVKTARSDEMITWYRVVFGARVVHQGRQVTFLSWDHEHHRLALVPVPSVLRYLFPLARLRRRYASTGLTGPPHRHRHRHRHR